MAGMYPNNQDIEIFGGQVSWPGVDASGKFTNGSFADPMVKPSFIPAETINLVLDNISAIITKCSGTPNATGLTQIVDVMTHLAQAETIVARDENGRAKVDERLQARMILRGKRKSTRHLRKQRNTLTRRKRSLIWR